jgi:hypothetical protein
VTEFEEHAYGAVAAALEAVPASKAQDVYVVSLLVYDEEDDPRLPTLTVGTNTEERVRERLGRDPPGWVRWNYAYWLQDDLFVVGSSETDSHGARLRRAWIDGLGLWYSDADERRDFDAAGELGAQITDHFVELSIRLVQRLHATGLIERVFGRPIPVLIHELEYYPQIAEQNERANPPGLTAEFTRWVLDH